MARARLALREEVENVKVNDGEYTYRIYPNGENKAEHIDIVHKPQ